MHAPNYACCLDYHGTYAANGTATFTWDAGTIQAPWNATATLTDDTLSVTYNQTMNKNDFENAVCTRVNE
ncbi:MAG TPA: hypothetical protein VGI12_05080 [Vicinamibacterales bacterium]|jgi:hypothetical protein